MQQQRSAAVPFPAYCWATAARVTICNNGGWKDKIEVDMKSVWQRSPTTEIPIAAKWVGKLFSTWPVPKGSYTVLFLDEGWWTLLNQFQQQACNQVELMQVGTVLKFTVCSSSIEMYFCCFTLFGSLICKGNKWGGISCRHHCSVKCTKLLGPEQL